MSKPTFERLVLRDDIYSDAVDVTDENGYAIIEVTGTPVLVQWREKLGIDHWSDDEKAFFELTLEQQTANAKHIVQCVNACKGVSTDMLHEGDYKAMIETNTALTVHMNQLSDALRKYEEAFDDLFGSCFSNGVFNAWGGTVNCTNLNEAHYMAGKALGKQGKQNHE